MTDLLVQEYAPAGAGIVLNTPTHIGFLQGLEIITDCHNDRFVYRVEGSASDWLVSPIDAESPHSLTYSETTSSFIADDTDSDRLLAFADCASAEAFSITALAGIALDKPHDVVFDPVTGFTYVLDLGVRRVFRLGAFGDEESVLDLTSVTMYSRALSIVDGTLYVIASSMGKVVEIVDLDQGEYVEHHSFGKVKNAPAGSWETTGLVLNDVERYQGYWYASSFFGPPWADGTDPNKFKLIRFRDWSDLENGTWEELSTVLPDAVIPYFFTLHEDSLFLATFYSQVLGGDTVYRMTSGLFFDSFECADLSRWSSVVSD